MIRFVLFLFLLATPVSLHAQNAPEKPERQKVFNAERFVLENGLEVVIIPNHRAPVATHMIWYKTGSADEPQGKSGIAHFLEHLMFKGSETTDGETLAPGAFSEMVKRLGGNDNAFTSQDYTAYHQSVSTEHLRKVMALEAGRMRTMNPPEKDVDSEHKVIREERRQRTDNDPRGLFGEKMQAALFPDHPYGIPVIGYPEEMEALSREDAMSFYHQWYAPNNAVMVISGDVTREEVQKLAEDTYGTIEKVELPERTRTARPPEDTLPKDNHVEMRHAAIRQPLVQIGMRVPSAKQDKQASLALDLMEEIAGGGPTSRLYKALVVDQKIASSAGFSYNSGTIDDSTIWVYASPLPGQELEAVTDALKTELRKLADEGVTQEELSDAKSRLQNEATYARDSLSGPAMIFGYALVTGSTVEDVEYWAEDIAGVSAEQIQQVAQKYIDPDNADVRMVSGYLLPEDKKESAEDQTETPEAEEAAP